MIGLHHHPHDQASYAGVVSLLLLLASSPTTGWKVIGYHTAKGDVEYNSTASAWRSYEWGKLTTLVNFGEFVDPAMLFAARAANVSVLGNGCCSPQSKGCTACPRGWTRTKLLLNATQRHLAIAGMVDFAVKHELAGINLDIEGNPAGSANAVTSLVCGLQAELKRRRGPSAVLAFDGPMLPTCYHDMRCNRTIPDVEDYTGRYDFMSISKCVDLILPMGYDLTGNAPDGGEAAANAPLEVVTEGLDEWLTLGVTSTKLALLLPWYGYDMACRRRERMATATSFGPGCVVQTPWGANNHEVGFGTAILWKQQEARRKPRSAIDSGRDADGSPWFIRHNTSGWRRKVYYDDAISIAQKVRMCREKGIAGVGVWTIDTLEALDGAEDCMRNQSKAMWAALWPATHEDRL